MNPAARMDRATANRAFPSDAIPKYLIRDRDGIYGTVVTRRIEAMGIRDRPTAPASALAERICRTIDWFDPARMLGLFHCLGRGASAPHPARLLSLL